MAEAMFQGTFAQVRPIAGRKVYQFIIEVPMERADAALKAMGGLPNPEESRWVAVARLDPKVTEQKPESPAERATSRNKNPEPWHTLKLSKRAAIMCGEPMFWGWAERQYRDASGGCLLSIQNAEHAADWLRFKTSVSSRKEYDTNEAAGRRYLEIEKSYRAHRMEVERYGEAS